MGTDGFRRGSTHAERDAELKVEPGDIKKFICRLLKPAPARAPIRRPYGLSEPSVTLLKEYDAEPPPAVARLFPSAIASPGSQSS